MTAGTFLVALTLVVLVLLLWHLRWVLLVLFGAVVVAVALLDAPWKAAAVLGAYVVIQNIESYVITPSVMHHQVKLLPGLTLAAQFLFTLLFGPLGLLMALPLAVVLQVIIREVLIHDVLDRWKRLEPAQ